MTMKANLQLNISWGNLYRTTHYNVCYNTLQNPQLTSVSEHDFNISRLLLPLAGKIIFPTKKVAKYS